MWSLEMHVETHYNAKCELTDLGAVHLWLHHPGHMLLPGLNSLLANIVFNWNKILRPLMKICNGLS